MGSFKKMSRSKGKGLKKYKNLSNFRAGIHGIKSEV